MSESPLVPVADHHADVIVVGAAMVGASAALALARVGFKVILVDRLVPATANRGIATTAMSAGSVNILETRQIHQTIRNAAQPILQVHVSQHGYYGSTRIRADDMQVEALGYVIDNADFSAGLQRQLRATESVSVVAPATVEALHQSAEFINVSTSHGSFRARLLLAVDGNQSRVRDLAGIASSVTDYDQCALLTTITTEQDHHGVAYERFTATGPLAMLPLDSRCMALVMTADGADAESLRCQSDADFLQHLQRQFGYRLGRLLGCTSRQVVPLRLQQAAAQRQGRVLLMGNAARLLHPVAGQGFNLALRDIDTLLELLTLNHSGTVINGATAGEVGQGVVPVCDDPGSDALLESFLTARAFDQRTTVRFTDLLARGFVGKSAGVSLLRSVGLLGVDSIPVLRRGLAQRAMGLKHGRAKLLPPHASG